LAGALPKLRSCSLTFLTLNWWPCCCLTSSCGATVSARLVSALVAEAAFHQQRVVLVKAHCRGIVGVLPPHIQRELVFEAVEAGIGGRGGRVGDFGIVAGSGEQGGAAKF
jgi:hypothetical protein